MMNMDARIKKHLDLIGSIFPSAISSVIVHEEGDDFLVLEINHGWMFRFPRNEVSAKALQVEKGFLAEFKATSPLPVPDYRYIGGDFVGYPKIIGTLLDMDVFREQSVQSLNKIACQMGQFLSSVHTFPVEQARRLGLTEGWDGWQSKGFRHFQDVIAPRLSPVMRHAAMGCIERTMNQPFETTVIHGDFSLEDHVFFDEKNQELCGVIDFADVTLNDPAHDFQNIVEYGGEGFFNEVMEHYQGVPDPNLLQRTRFRIEARPIFEAAYSSMFGFDERYKDRMAYIEQRYG